MAPHQLRVIAEKAELVEKRQKIATFMGTATFKALPQIERDLLIIQDTFMAGYDNTLACRIHNFTGERECSVPEVRSSL